MSGSSRDDNKMNKNWTEDLVAILLGAVILAVALLIFLLAPLGSVSDSVAQASQTAGFSTESWMAENDFINAGGEFLNSLANTSRPGRWSANPFAAFSLDTLLFGVSLLVVFGAFISK